MEDWEDQEHTLEEIEAQAKKLLTDGPGGEFVQYIHAVIQAGDREGYREVMRLVWILFGIGLFCKGDSPKEWPAAGAVRLAVDVIQEALTGMARLEMLASNANMENNRN